MDLVHRTGWRPDRRTRRRSRTRPAALVWLGLLACACGTGGGVESELSTLDGNLRLGRSVVPLHYRLDLRIDPTSERFSGTSSIRVRIDEPLRALDLHAQDLELLRVERRAGDGPARELAFETGPNGALRLSSEEPLAGEVLLHFEWESALGEQPVGLYRVEEGGRAYAFTQLQPLEARKVFPCFDQPEFKTPFAVTLRAPAGQLALANAPLERRDPAPDASGDERFVFHETRPLPTYLVAFAVGDFEVVEGSGEPPLRVVAPRGKGRLSGFALERTPKILAWLVDYFDQPFPYAKLDLVAVPNFGAGAMENVGLVTFRERLLLLDGARAPLWARYASQSVIAHELAHMWFGNLVTLAWWDDLWLNESFATWMSGRVLDEVAPELDARLDAVRWAQRTMRLDSKRDARPVRQPIAHGGDVYNAFDGITYGKGAAVLRMVEAWLGEESFRDGVRAYVRDHAHGTGGTVELLSALEAASGKPVARAMQRFLDQPGTPLVEAALECGDAGPGLVRIRQSRALPAGSDATVGEPWTLPVCLALGAADGGRARECFLVEEREQRVELALDGCPRWIHPNADERGYYRWSLPGEDWVALVDEHGAELTDAELAAIPGHAFALLEAERIEIGEVLDALRALAPHPRRQVESAVVDALSRIHDAGVPDPKGVLAAAWGREMRALFGPPLDRIGLLPAPGESAETRLRRGALVETLAGMGRDPRVRTRAQSIASAFVSDPTAADEEALTLLLPVAASGGDEALWDALVEILSDPPSPVVRSAVVSSLGRFRNPKLVRKSLDLVLDGRLRAQDYRTVARAVHRDLRGEAWSWMQEHYAELAPKLGPMTSTDLPGIATGLCSDADADSVERFFAARSDAPEGTLHNVGLVSEDIRRCARLRASLDGVLAEALGAN